MPGPYEWRGAENPMEHYPRSQSTDNIGNMSAQNALTAQAQSGGQLIVRSPNAPPMDLGSQVAARRNLEFSAGQRSHRISMGSYTKA